MLNLIASPFSHLNFSTLLGKLWRQKRLLNILFSIFNLKVYKDKCWNWEIALWFWKNKCSSWISRQDYVSKRLGEGHYYHCVASPLLLTPLYKCLETEVNNCSSESKMFPHPYSIYCRVLTVRPFWVYFLPNVCVIARACREASLLPGLFY